MKKQTLSKFMFLASFLFLVFAIPFASATLDFSEDSITVDDERDESVDAKVTVTNSGATDLTGIEFTYNTNDFYDGDENVTLSFSSNNFDLTNGSNLEVTITADIHEDIILDSYQGTITVKDSTGNFTDTLTFRVDVRPTGLCEDGRVGDEIPYNFKDGVEITKIDNPDDGDDFKPLEEIEVDVDVDNNFDKDLDVELRAFLIDKEDDDILEEIAEVSEVEEDKDETFKMDLEVPADVEDASSSRYAVYIMASEDGREEDFCDWQKVDIEIDKEDDDVIVNEVITEPLICGSPGNLFVELVNAGIDDQRDVNVKMFIPSLGIEQSSIEFDLDESDERKVGFSFDISKDTPEGQYNGRVEVRDKSDDLYENGIEGFSVEIICEEPEVLASLSLSQTRFTSKEGSTITVVATVTNTGDLTETFTVRVNPLGSWTDFTEMSVNLASGDARTELINLAVRESGSHSATVEVLADGQVLSTQTITLDSRDETEVSQTSPSSGSVTAGTISNSLGDNLPLMVIIGILALAIIVLLIMLLMHGRHHSHTPSKASSNGKSSKTKK